MSSEDEQYDSDLEVTDAPPSIDPYEVLGIGRDVNESQIKTAYRKAALKNHPDKVPEADREGANVKFQEIAFAYAVLSDPVRRKRYDETGSTSESIVDSEGFNWSDYYRSQYADAISADAIAKFAAIYKNSDEEKDDVLIAYEQAEGDMDLVYETVMLSDVQEDDERFRKIIDDAIKSGDVKAFKAYTKETKAKRSARTKAAKKEATEAEEYAKELGVHDKLFGATVDSTVDEDPAPAAKGKAKPKAAVKGKKKQASSEDALAALIRGNQQKRAGFLDALESKYTALEEKKGGKRKRAEAMPTDEEFDRIQAGLSKNKKAKVEQKPTGRKTRRT